MNTKAVTAASRVRKPMMKILFVRYTAETVRIQSMTSRTEYFVRGFREQVI
jgi:hypothetical protein